MTPNPASVSSTLRARVSTGYRRLDEALQGGFLTGSSVVLCAPASDEVPFMIQQFLKAVKEPTLLVTRSLSLAQSITNDQSSNLKVLVCSDKPVPASTSILPGRGIDNLTELNFQLNEILNSQTPARIATDILSDALLRHKALQTRKWLAELLERLRAKNITTLAVFNPYMHTSEDAQAIVDLFDGDLEITENSEGIHGKFLRVGWMHGIWVKEKQLPLQDLMPVQVPEVKYAKSGKVHVAYQVFGNGPVNLVVTPGSVSHLNYYWQEPGLRRSLEMFGEFSKVAIFDKRGTGLSDRDTSVPTFEERMDDIRAVMDAAHFEDAVLVGLSEGVPMSILFAASYPSRTRGLVLYGGEAKGSWAPDYPWEATEEQWEASFKRTENTWGTKEWVERAVSWAAPSRLGDERFTQWLGEMFRMGASPGSHYALGRSEMNMDVRSILPAIHVPTLVIHLTGDKACNIGEGRYIAQHIPNARLVELPGVDHMFFVDSELTDKVLREIKAFALKVKPLTNVDRRLTTVLLTDVVDSSKRAAENGDSNWRSLIEQYDSAIAREVERYSGVVVKRTGCGFLATFDGPTRAIRCGWAATKSAKELDMEVRAGIHTGECIIGPTDVSGIAVQLASSVLQQASAGDVLVSSTVKDLVYGSGISFEDRGEYELKGIEDKKHLFSVASID